MEMQVLILWVEGHSQGRKEIKPFSEVMNEFSLSAEKLNSLISSGEVYEGKCFDESLTLK